MKDKMISEFLGIEPNVVYLCAGVVNFDIIYRPDVKNFFIRYKYSDMFKLLDINSTRMVELLTGKYKIYKTAETEESSALNKLCKEAYENARSKGWHDDERTFGEYISLVHSELSEALEDYRSGRGVNELYYEEDKPCGIPVELADVLIRIFDFCGLYDIDLQNAIDIKMKYNKTRSHRHGGKKI
jgi:NTP pyrophosphatase (non-canonical NTP hydrolase)